jgi:hypothetical protein
MGQLRIYPLGWQKYEGGVLSGYLTTGGPHPSTHLKSAEQLVSFGPLHCFPMVTGFGFIAGHAANSQFGPVRPTAEPSGHIFASIVQALGDFVPPSGKPGVFLVSVHATPMPAITITDITMRIASVFFIIFFT